MNLTPFFRCGVWAIEPQEFRRLLAVAAGPPPAVEAKPRPPRIEGTLAVIPVYGVLTQHGSPLDWFFGGVSCDAIGAAIDKAMADPNVGGILLDIDSPGGEVFGLQALAAQLRAAREEKTIVAVANSMAASGGYYLLSQATTAYVAPGGMVGSVGVLWSHTDLSGAEEQLGIKTEHFSEPDAKRELWENELSAEAREWVARMVGGYYQQFLADVAAGRGVSKATVAAEYGQGRVVMAADAKAAGMVDGIATVQEVAAGMLAASKPRKTARLELERQRLAVKKAT